MNNSEFDGSSRRLRDALAEIEELRLRLAAVEARAADRDRLKIFFEHAPDAVYLNDLRGVLVDGNPAAEQLIGYSKEELVGRCFLELGLLPDAEIQRAAELLARNLAGENTGPDEFHLIHKDGTRIPVEIISFRVQLEGEVMVVGFVRETGARKRLEEQVRQAHKLEAIGQLAGGIAHDFNNLLLAINGYAQLALDTMEPEDPHRHSIVEISKAGGRAASLTRQLLAFGRRQPLAHVSIAVNDLIGETIEMLRPVIPENITVRFEPSPDAGFVRADASQLMQVLVNLSVNARDAMPAGGTLTIVAGTTERPPTDLPEAPDCRAWECIQISDTGEGMDAATLGQIFDPFFTTKAPGAGTGLGLSTAYGVVRQHGGEIRASSTPGKGTRFRIYLPTADPPTIAEVPAATSPPAYAADDAAILVVEDDEQVRGVVDRILSRAGYEVVLAAGKQQASKIIAAQGDRFRLLLTDVVMPGGSGPALFAEVAAAHPHLKVLFMSGYAPQEPESEATQLPSPLLHKPFAAPQLLAAVRDALDS